MMPVSDRLNLFSSVAPVNDKTMLTPSASAWSSYAVVPCHRDGNQRTETPPLPAVEIGSHPTRSLEANVVSFGSWILALWKEDHDFHLMPG
jgi:hypothetical protein